MKDVDGVLISTPEHSHSPILKMAAEAGKDAYVEKPMGNVLTRSKSGARRGACEPRPSSRSARSIAANPIRERRKKWRAAGRSAM